MLYKFFYYSNGIFAKKMCYSEREAIIFFDILVSAHIPFSIYTIKRRLNNDKISKR